MAARAWERRRELSRLSMAVRKVAREPSSEVRLTLDGTEFVVLGEDRWQELEHAAQVRAAFESGLVEWADVLERLRTA